MSRTRARQPAVLTPRFKVWLETDGKYAFGFGLGEMLRAIDRAGSIKAAAADLGKSYRHVWGRIKAAERTLGEALVETQVGGTGLQRSTLTPRARLLVERFALLRGRLAVLLAEEFARAFPQGTKTCI